MLQRTLVGTALLGLVGLPYVLSTKSTDSTVAGRAADEMTSIAQVPPGGAPEISAHDLARARSTPPTRPDEIFRFDLTADTVVRRWPLVATTTNQPELKGYRVPLVTGGRDHDLAGSLTYYFNAEQQVERIAFHGTTGDPRPLVQFLTRKFGFQAEPTNDAGLERYQVKSWGKEVSELRLQTAQLMDAMQPRRRYQIDLLIQRPKTSWSWFGGDGSSAPPTSRSGLRL